MYITNKRHIHINTYAALSVTNVFSTVVVNEYFFLCMHKIYLSICFQLLHDTVLER